MYAHFNLRKAPKRKDLGIASKVSPVNLIVLVSLIRIPQFSPLYLIEPEDGSHRELMMQHGMYHKLYMNQFADLQVEAQIETYEQQLKDIA